MCIVAIAWQLFDELPLVLLSNRDEFLMRPTEPLHQWADLPIYAGRDKQSGGTWLGIHQQPQPLPNPKAAPAIYQQNGRWAAVLNFRDAVQARADERSRGELVSHFLTSELSPMAFARQISLQDYAGFNLIVGNTEQAVIVNNRGHAPTPLYAGLHVLSNGQPEDNWFKTEKLRGRLRQEVLPLISEDACFDYWQHAALQVMSDTTAAPIDRLPDTGMACEIELALSSIYIAPLAFDTIKPDSKQINSNQISSDKQSAAPTYGTRTQSILTLQRRHAPDAQIRATLMSYEVNTHQC